MKSRKAESAITKTDHEKFAADRKILDNARVQLKKEFIGIDSIVDEVVRQVSPWFLFPELIEKPYLINLWGMTGVGKTALINRLVDLLGCNAGFAYVSLNSPEGKWLMSGDDLETIAEKPRKIIFFDEFQHARTIDKNGTELDVGKNLYIWDLLDTGEIKRFNDTSRVSQLKEILLFLKALAAKGVRANNGIVTKREALFKKELLLQSWSRYEREQSATRFFPSSMLNLLFSPGNHRAVRMYKQRASAKSCFTLLSDARKFLDRLNEYETIDFLQGVINDLKIQQNIHLRNLLIFVAGNLDEAYSSAGNFNNEIDVDEFFRANQRIDVLRIKEALKQRFRPEQIARLGNNHILYPGISQDSYGKIIDSELKKISDAFFKEKEIRIEFGREIRKELFLEGVTPTQGIRPLLSTIDQMIKANIGQFYTFIFENSFKADRIHVESENGRMKVAYFSAGELLTSEFFADFPGKRCKNMPVPDEKQALIAVHEAGHLIASTIMRGEVPQIAFSRSNLPGMHGYTHFETDERSFLNYGNLMPELVAYLAGLAAEKLVFGRRYQSLGAKGDILQATCLLKNALAFCGIGVEKASFSLNIERDETLHDVKNIEGKVKDVMKKAFKIATRLLSKEKLLLTETAKYLAENPSISGQMFLHDYFNKFATQASFNRFHRKKFSYREQLFAFSAAARSEKTRKAVLKLLETADCDSSAA